MLPAEAKERYGDYQLVRRLGVGGMAETFEALRQGPGGFEQRVCLKRVLPAFGQDAEFVRQFRREAQLAASLRHSNIVGVVDFGEEESQHYMALELVDGIDLKAYLREQDPPRLRPSIVTFIAIELAYALQYAHGDLVDPEGEETIRGIVHRDISPANVLISRAGEIKLADFGIAKAITTTAATASGTVKGKIPYMAPEQMRGDSVDGRADLFSLGVLLFELLAGVRPFVGAHDVEIMTRVLDGDRPKLEELSPDTPKPLRDAIERLLHIDPDRRTQNASQLIDELSVCTPSPTDRRALARDVESALGGVATRRHVQAQREVTASSRPPSADPSRAPTALPSPDAGTRSEKRIRNRSPRWLAAALLSGGALLLSVGFWRLSERDTAEKGADGDPNVLMEVSSDEPPNDTTTSAEIRDKMKMPVAPNTAPDPGLTHVVRETRVTDTVEKPNIARTKRGTRPTKRVVEPPDQTGAKGTLSVVVIPRGRVWVDGRFMGEAPTLVKLPAGSHRVQAGFTSPTTTRKVRLQRGKRSTVEINLE